MIAQYRKTLLKLKDELDYLMDNPEDLDALYKYQLHLIKYIKRIESRIRNLKNKNKKCESAQLALSIFKTFGDSIAFGYIDTHNLKQLTFNIEDEELKNKSGFISDKEGFDYELECLKKVIYEVQIPALLCDLTNSIRYGDILILVFDDPVIIECKSGKARGNRNARQKKTLQKLGKFYTHDKKEMYYGTRHVERIANSEQPIRYTEKLNQLIDDAYSEGTISAKIETGVYYIISKNLDDIPAELKKIDLKNPYIVFLNMIKNNQDWVSYIPYPLSIYNKEHLIDFIIGTLGIVVIIDLYDIKRIASRLDLKYEETTDRNMPLQFYLFGEDKTQAIGFFGLSGHYLMRVFLEMYSLEWLIRNSLAMWKEKAEITSTKEN